MSMVVYTVVVTIGDVLNKIVNIVNIQRDFGNDQSKIIKNILRYVESLKIKKQSIIVLHELSLTRYFPITKKTNTEEKLYHVLPDEIDHFLKLCKKKKVYLIMPLCEKTNNKSFFNTTIIISPDGKIIAKQRKVYIPNETCYNEKHYFKKSDRLKVFDIGICKLGILICWDQWYPENYQKLSAQQADIIISPTSIGYASKRDKSVTLKNEKKNWEMTIKMNSLLTSTPVIVANRCSTEISGVHKIKFWGSSFITNSDGEIIIKAGQSNKTIKTSINLGDKLKSIRKWGFKRP